MFWLDATIVTKNILRIFWQRKNNNIKSGKFGQSARTQKTKTRVQMEEFFLQDEKKKIWWSWRWLFTVNEMQNNIQWTVKKEFVESYGLLKLEFVSKIIAFVLISRFNIENCFLQDVFWKIMLKKDACKCS